MIPGYVSAECRDLIQKILNINPARRYTTQDIRRHPWMNRGESGRELQGVVVGLHKIPVRKKINGIMIHCLIRLITRW